MRTTIDFGIDLGTTNSSVAVSEGAQVEIIKNNDNQEITPSVVQILASGAVIVGRKAYEHLRSHDDGNAYEGAKRQMGKREQRYPFADAGISKGPEDLAAEVLKSLRADAETWAGQPVRAAVITVPAAFELAQAEATQRAARAAGITQAPLLQEPIAAGLAYGYQREIEDGYFIVYDLGGGTSTSPSCRFERADCWSSTTRGTTSSVDETGIASSATLSLPALWVRAWRPGVMRILAASRVCGYFERSRRRRRFACHAPTPWMSSSTDDSLMLSVDRSKA